MSLDAPAMLGRRRLLAAVWMALAGAALLYQGLNLAIAFDPDDTENLETTLVMAAARQFEDGPRGLYGPYSASNPRVLIQAPLYYRLTALLAVPLVKAGYDAVPACITAGRLLSWASFLGCLFILHRLATLDGAPARAGRFAVVLALGSPLIGSFPATVRPDMLGVFLQTLGIWLVLRLVVAGRGGTRELAIAYAVFALALGVKQHYLVPAAASTVLLGAAWLRKQVRLGPILLAHGVGLAVAVAYLALEEALTAGAMLQSVVTHAQQIRVVAPGSWNYVGVVLLVAAKRSFGLLALGAALLAGWIGRGATFPLNAQGTSGSGVRSRPDRGLNVCGLDGCLLVLVVGELVLMANLCLASAGAWYNYAIPAVLVLCVVLGRALAGLLDREIRPGAALPVGLACLVLVAMTARGVGITLALRQQSHRTLEALLENDRARATTRDQRYFAGPLQHFNRRFGNQRLLHDEWLYGVLEKIDAAQPRNVWLRASLVHGPITQIVLPREFRTVPGIPENLRELGYAPVAEFGELRLWERCMGVSLSGGRPAVTR